MVNQVECLVLRALADLDISYSVRADIERALLSSLPAKKAGKIELEVSEAGERVIREKGAAWVENAVWSQLSRENEQSKEA